MASIFEAAQSGDVATLRSLLDGGSQVDLNIKDGDGQSALVVAAREGHVDVVQELVSRGADRHEALSQGLGQDGSPIAAILNQPLHINAPQHNGDQMYGPIPTDVYGGYQLPDGSIAYGYPGYPPPFQGATMGQPAFYHDPIMFPHPHMQQPYAYPPQGINGASRSRPSPNMPEDHVRKPSAVGKYPPPDVAKTIPCRFYPNCRNGASCIFAHIDSPGTGEATSLGQLASPTHPAYAAGPAPPHANFYSTPPYAASSVPFFPGGVPVASVPFTTQGRGPLPLHYQPQEGSQPGQMTSEAPKEVISSPQIPAQQSPETSDVTSTVLVTGPSIEAAPTSSTSPEHHASEVAHQVDGPESSATASMSLPAGAADGQDRRRRQSFNSFLHSHAVPFQPSQMAASIQNAAVSIPLGPAATMNGMHGMQHHLGLNGHGGFPGMPHGYGSRGKMRGRGGVAGMGGRGPPRERTPCTFFAKNACKYGPDCLYPHLLPDGTDARHYPGGVPAGFHLPHHGGEGATSGAFKGNGIHLTGQIHRPTPVARVSDGEVKSNNNHTEGSTGSAAIDLQTKKAAGLPPTPSAEVTAPSRSENPHTAVIDSKAVTQKRTSEEPPVTNGFVPSKPSATALADAAAADSTSVAAKTTTLSAPAAPASVPTAPIPAPDQQKQQHPNQQTQQRGPHHPSTQQRKGNAGKSSGTQGQNGSSASMKKTPAQRIPSNADFPALGGPTNGSSASALAGSTANASSKPSSMAASVNVGEGNTAASSTQAPVTSKINFSAILSAPAPPKKAPESTSASPALNGTSEASTPSAGEEGSAPSHDVAEGQANGLHSPSVNGAPAAPPTLTNGHAKEGNKQPKARAINNKGSSHSVGGKAWGSSKSQNGSQSSTSTAQAKEPEVDEDDFQLVKGRNHGKRSQSAGPAAGSRNSGGVASFAAAAKTSVIA